MIWQELTTGIYPWDIHDEGIENILDNLQAMAGNNAAYMLAIMHHEKRPLHANYYPHNPVRKRYIAEDSRCYFHIHPECYANSRIKPLPSERDFLKDVDWLDLFVRALRRRGMKTGAEISHTPLDAKRGLALYADCLQRDIYGNPPPYGIMTGQQLCWNSKDARDYVYAIAADLATHYDLDMIQTCSLLYNPGRLDIHPLLGVTLGGCFCENCEREARAQGLDWDAILRTVRGLADIVSRADIDSQEAFHTLRQGDSSHTSFLLEYPALYEWLLFRTRSVTRYLQGLTQAIHAANPKVEFRLNTCWKEGEMHGLNLAEAGKVVDSIRMMDYSEQTGDIALVTNKTKWLANVRRMVGEEKKIIAGIAPRHLATPELVKLGIRQVSLGGADGLSYGFYDGAPYENLRAIREAMEDYGIKLAK
ncbi:MAG TPA: hypothetical protein PKE04_12545 [Clostridia bacterium]|nr:hypothetical protein [Clostridia bacterium]